MEKEKIYFPELSDGRIENICILRNICRLLPEFDRFILHSAVIQYGDSGYVFLGKSGAGKTTHARLWQKYVRGAEILCGDKPIVGRENGIYYAYGTPWRGKENFGKKGKVRLKGLCFIEKASTNLAFSLSADEASERLYEQLLFFSEACVALKTAELAIGLLQTVPAFLLRCDKTRNAVVASFECMTGIKFSE